MITNTALSQPHRVQNESTEYYVLKNGLRVVLQRDISRPRIGVVVTYRVGSGHDPLGYSGMAHLAEHMSFRGSRHIKAGGAFEQLQSVGATAVNGMTTQDATYYMAEIPCRELPLLLWIESDRMAFITDQLNQKTLELEKKIIHNELRNREYWNKAKTLMVQGAYPQGHAYHRAGDSESEIDDIEVEHLQWFFQTYYRPDNATLAIVGSFEPEKTKSLIEKYFGPIRASGYSKPDTLVPPVVYSGKKSMEIHAGWDRDEIKLQWNIPCYAGACYSKLLLLRTYIESNLEQGLLKRMNLASDIYVDLNRLQQHMEFKIVVKLTLNIEFSEVEPILVEQLERLKRREITKNDLVVIRTKTEVGEMIRWQNLLHRAVSLAEMRPIDKPDRFTDIFTIIRDIRRTTPQEIQAAARLWLPLDSLLQVYLVIDKHAQQPHVKNVKGDLHPQVTRGKQ